MKRLAVVILVVSGCAHHAARPGPGAPRPLPLAEFAACFAQHDAGLHPTSWLLSGPRKQAKADPPRVGDCLQDAVNAAPVGALLAEEEVVLVGWYPTGKPAPDGAIAVSGRGAFIAAEGVFTRPTQRSGEFTGLNPQGELGMAIVRCYLPISGKPERCRDIKRLRGQEPAAGILNSTFSPCMVNGVAYDCDYVWVFNFRLRGE